MTKDVGGLALSGKPFPCNPGNYKSLRPPKKFLLNRIKREIQSVDLNQGCLLDIGCGNAGYIKEIKQQLGLSVVGIDSALGMLEQASDCDDSMLLVNGSFNDNLPFKSGVFDGVISIDSIHFAKNLGRLFEEVNRVLSPGGLFIICTHTEDDLSRQTLGTFFPAAIDIEFPAAKRLRRIHAWAQRVGLRRVSQSQDILKFALDRSHVALFEKKCASVLHKISAFDFNRGMKTLRRAAATKRKVANHSYTTFVFKKQCI